MKINKIIEQKLVIKKQSKEDRRVYCLRINSEMKNTFAINDINMDKALEKAMTKYSEREIDIFPQVLKTIDEEYLEGMENGK